MTYRGHVEKGLVVLDDPVALEEGAQVHIEVLPASCTSPEPDDMPSLAERLAPIIGTVHGLPEDASVNHDHYLCGIPKR